MTPVVQFDTRQNFKRNMPLSNSQCQIDVFGISQLRIEDPDGVENTGTKETCAEMDKRFAEQRPGCWLFLREVDIF